jgi:hypothetical protein
MPVGIRDWFRTDYPASYGQVEVGLRSPFLPASSHLAVVTAPGFPDAAVTVGKALGCPPVARAVSLTSTVISSVELTAEEGDAPAWCSQTDLTIGQDYKFSSVAITPAHRWALVLQDLFFYNASLLWKDDIDEDFRPVNGLSHVARGRWNLDSEGYVEIDGVRQDSRHLVLVQGLMPAGFLEIGKTTINHYHQLQETILNRASMPAPLLDLHITDPNFQPEPSYINEAGEKVEGEMEEIARVWGNARQSKNGAVAVSPHWLEVKALGEGRMDMLTEARNAARLDVANFANLNAALLDGNNGTSDTYSNTLQNKDELLTLSMPLWMLPIETRLSQNDVTAPGVKLKFDTSGFTTTDAKGNTGNAVAPAEPEPSND